MADLVETPAAEPLHLACANCDYYLHMPAVKDQPPQGQCRANPPDVIGFPVPVQTLKGTDIQLRIQAAWPVVGQAEWCGAHSALDSGEATETPQQPENPSVH